MVLGQAASQADLEKALEGVVLTSPAVRVKPAHPVIGVKRFFISCATFSLVKVVFFKVLANGSAKSSKLLLRPSVLYC